VAPCLCGETRGLWQLLQQYRNTIAGGSWLLEDRGPEETFTPEDFNEQHQLIAQTAEEFAQNEIVPTSSASSTKSGR